MLEKNFSEKLYKVERRAWVSFILLCQNFLGNKRSTDYVEVVAEFLEARGEIGCRMSIKIHLLDSHLDSYSKMAFIFCSHSISLRSKKVIVESKTWKLNINEQKGCKLLIISVKK